MIYSTIIRPTGEPLVWFLIALLSGQGGLSITPPAKSQATEQSLGQPGQTSPNAGAPDTASQTPVAAAPEPAAPATPTAPGAPAATSPAMLPVKDIFAVRSWLPPPPPVEAAAPQAPQTPPLPFQFIGRIHETGKTPVVLLKVGERVLPFSIGQIINSEWRLSGDNGRQLVFRYRPLNTVQTLNASQRETP